MFGSARQRSKWRWRAQIGEPTLEPRVGAELVGNDPTVFRYMAYTVTELSSNIKNRTKKKSFSFVHISKSALLYV